MGLVLVLVQVAMILAAAPKPGGSLKDQFRGTYLTLVQHDSFWFQNIIERGYASPIPPAPRKSFQVSNVAFFPGFPLMAGLLARLGNLDTRIALLLVSQFFACVFWAYVLVFLISWGVPVWLGASALALVFAHPAMIFLVMGYSESLFLAAVLGFIYWSGRPGVSAALLAGLHGFGMTATRIVGLPCALVAVLRRLAAPWLNPKTAGASCQSSNNHCFGTLGKPLLVSLFSLCGALAFFVFCQLRFGSWDFYMQTQRAGWGIVPDYIAPLRWKTYAWGWPDWKDPLQLSQFSVTMTLLSFAVVAICERALSAVKRVEGASARVMEGTQLLARLPFYLCALCMFYLAVSGVSSVQFQSMIRYQFCTHVMLVLGLVHLTMQLPSTGRHSRWFKMAVAAASALVVGVGVHLSLHYAAVMTRSGWFA